MYETLFSPFEYGGLTLKNRVIFSPTSLGVSPQEQEERLRRIAAGGCALIILGDVPVGKSRFEKSLFDKKGFAWYQSLAEIVHSCGCKLCAQLHQSDSNMAAMLKYVPGCTVQHTGYRHRILAQRGSGPLYHQSAAAQDR